MRVLFVAAFLVFVTVAGGCGGSGGGGDSGDGGPQATVITDVLGLQAMRDDVAGAYVLGGNIDCTETSGWDGGAGFEPIEDFEGTLDGAGFEISHLFINRPSSGIGLFASLTDTGSVRDVRLTGAHVSGQWQVGILIGTNSGTVRNCSTAGTVFCSHGDAGGLVGVSYGTIIYCSSAATVENIGLDSTGGLVAENRGSISRSYTTGHVSVPEDSVGGLVGKNISGSITDCYSTATVSGDESVGGLVGQNGYNGALVERCYSSGPVSGSTFHCGGLVAANGGTGWASEEIRNCFTVSSTTGSSYVGGLVGTSAGAAIVGGYWDITRTGQAAGSSSAHAGDQMTGVNAGNAQPAYFYSSSSAPLSSWDFTTVWQIEEGVSLPTLRPDSE